MKMERDGENKSGKPAGLRLLTKKDVARLPACSIRMVERLVASGTLTAVKIRGAVRFRSSDIEQKDLVLGRIFPKPDGFKSEPEIILVGKRFVVQS
jgi:excisionase family DNA binding protein